MYLYERRCAFPLSCGFILMPQYENFMSPASTRTVPGPLHAAALPSSYLSTPMHLARYCFVAISLKNLPIARATGPPMPLVRRCIFQSSMHPIHASILEVECSSMIYQPKLECLRYAVPSSQPGCHDTAGSTLAIRRIKNCITGKQKP